MLNSTMGTNIVKLTKNGALARREFGPNAHPLAPSILACAQNVHSDRRARRGAVGIMPRGAGLVNKEHANGPKSRGEQRCNRCRMMRSHQLNDAEQILPYDKIVI